MLHESFLKALGLSAFFTLLPAVADTSGMDFWKNGNSSATNRADAAGVSLLACSTAFSTLPRSDTVEITGLNLNTRPAGLFINLK